MTMTIWHDADTPPTEDGVYLAYNPSPWAGEDMFMARYDVQEGDWTIHIDGAPIRPTHWADRPEPPQEVQR